MPQNRVTTFYLYDTEGRLIEELDASGNVLARYVHGAGLISRADSGQVSVYHYDSLGSALALTDATTGAITDRYAYTPYGGVQHGPGNATPNPFTYAGRDGVVDDGNGLYYMRARYYAPELMRFVQKDPAYAGELGRPQSLNRYAYVEGNPIELTDPTGEWGIVGIAIGAAVGAVANATKAAIEGKDLEGILEAGAEGAVAGAIVGATGGAGLAAGAIGGGFAAFTGGNIAVGVAVGALSTFGLGAAVAATFAGEFYEAGGGLQDRAIAGGIGAGSTLAFGVVGKAGGKELAKIGLTKRLSQTGVAKKIGDRLGARAARKYVARADRLAAKLHKPGSAPLHDYMPGIVNASEFARSAARTRFLEGVDEFDDAAIEYIVTEQIIPVAQ
jgi:RHS repeat-associated protein